MYYIYGISGPSLLMESTDSVIYILNQRGMIIIIAMLILGKNVGRAGTMGGIILFRDSLAAGKLLVLIHGLDDFRIDLLVLAGISFLALALLLLFHLGGCFSFKSGVGQKKLTEKPLC